MKVVFQNAYMRLVWEEGEWKCLVRPGGEIQHEYTEHLLVVGPYSFLWMLHNIPLYNILVEEAEEKEWEW